MVVHAAVWTALPGGAQVAELPIDREESVEGRGHALPLRGIGREAQHFSDKGRTGREGHDNRALHEKERCIGERLLLGGHLAAGHAPNDNRDERIALGIVHHHVSHRFLQSYR